MADAMQRFHALLTPGSSSSVPTGESPLSPILPAMQQLHGLLQAAPLHPGTSSTAEFELAAALFESCVIDDLLRTAFEQQLQGAQGVDATAEISIRAVFHSALASRLCSAAAALLSQQLHAPGAASGPALAHASSSATGTVPQDAWALRFGSFELEASAALEAADAALSRAQAAEPDQEEPELDWLDEEALLQQSGEAEEAEGAEAAWDTAAFPPERPNSRALQQQQPFFDFDEGPSRPESRVGNHAEASVRLESAEEQAGVSRIGGMELEPFMAFDNELGSLSGELLEPDLALEGNPITNKPAAQQVVDTAGDSSGTAEPAAGSQSTSHEWSGISAAAAPASQPLPGGDIGQQRPEATEPAALSEASKSILDAMSAAALSGGRLRAARLRAAADEAGAVEAAGQLAAARAALARFEWVHELVLAAAGALGPPVELPPRVSSSACPFLPLLVLFATILHYGRVVTMASSDHMLLSNQ